MENPSRRNVLITGGAVGALGALSVATPAQASALWTWSPKGSVAGARAEYQAHLADLMLRRQEKDGSWWDYPLYNYHQPYGTAFALMTLVRCREP
jgi:hypothetical protein